MTLPSKPAETQVPLHPLLQNRWSPRAFSGETIERKKLLALFEAVRWSASSRNEQPWAMLAVTKDNEADFSRMVRCLVPGNQEWAPKAPLLLLLAARTAFADGRPNKHAWYDVGAAVTSLTIQALDCGLYVHQMGGFDAEAARKEFQIPKEFEPVVVLAVGAQGDPQSLPDKRREQELAPRARKPLSNFVFAKNWGAAAEFL